MVPASGLVPYGNLHTHNLQLPKHLVLFQVSVSLLTFSLLQLGQLPVCFLASLIPPRSYAKLFVCMSTSLGEKESTDLYYILKGVCEPKEVRHQCSPQLLAKNLSGSSTQHVCQIPNYSLRC